MSGKGREWAERPASCAGPALIRKAVIVFTQDDVIEERDTEKVTGLAEAGGEGMIFRAWRRIAGRMIVGAQEGAGVHQNEGLEDLARMNDGNGQGTH